MEFFSNPVTVKSSRGFNKIRQLVDIHDPTVPYFGSRATFNPAHKPDIFNKDGSYTFPYTLDKNVKGNVHKIPESTAGLVRVGSTSLQRFTLPCVAVLVPLTSDARISSDANDPNMRTLEFFLPKEHLTDGLEAYSRAAVALAVLAVADGVVLTRTGHL